MQDGVSGRRDHPQLAAEIWQPFMGLQETGLVLSVRGCGQRGRSCHYAVSWSSEAAVASGGQAEVDFNDLKKPAEIALFGVLAAF